MTATTFDTFDLNLSIREALSAYAGNDPPRDVGRQVAETIPDDARLAVLADILPDVVRREMGRGRRAITGQVAYGGGGGSARWAMVREAYEAGELTGELLEQWCYVGKDADGKNRYLRLADCTRENLEFVADHYADLSRANGVRAEQYRCLAEKVGDGRVSDLPLAAVEEVFKL